MVKINRNIINNKNIEMSAFILAGTYKTVSDYKNIKEKYKAKILLNDTVILSATALGMLGYREFGKSKFANKTAHAIIEYFDNVYKNFSQNNRFMREKVLPRISKLEHPLKKPISYSKEIIGGILSDMTFMSMGLLSAILADFGLSKTGLSVYNLKKKQIEDRQNLINLSPVENFKHQKFYKEMDKAGYNNTISQLTWLPIFDSITSTFIGLESLKMTEEKEHLKQLKHASQFLLVNSLAPVTLISLSSTLTKNMKGKYRYPIMLTSLIGGTTLVNKVLKKHISKAEEKENLQSEISSLKQNLIGH